MFRISLKGVWAHRTRLVLTLLAIMLGVGLISGVNIYTDTINRGFKNIFTEAFSGLDIVVLVESDFTFGEGAFITQTEFEQATNVDGVEQAYPEVSGFGLALIDKDGEVIGGQGPPTITSSITEGNTAGFVIGEGSYPVGPQQVALDQETARANDYNIGDRVSLVSEQVGLINPILVGTAQLAQLGDLGIRQVLFDLTTAQEVLGLSGQVSGGSVYVTGGTSVDDVINRMTPLLPENAVALSGQQAAEQEAAELQEGLSFFTIFLAVFGYIALFVGAFLIYNTFRIVVSQRTRELAMLRAIGASKRQVRAIVLLESFLLGIMGSLLGLGFGFLTALLLQAGLGAVGISFPSAPLTLQAGTVIVALWTGTLVTVLSSLIPARRASRVAVMDALSEHPTFTARSRPALKRMLSGGAVLVVGFFSSWLGLFGGGWGNLSEVAWVGIGAGIIFVGMFIISPLLARPITSVLGWIAQKISGVSGKLARRNAMRSPRRTAATAGAVMISITLVALASILSGSLRATIDEVLGSDLDVDLIVSNSETFNPFAGFTSDLGDDIEALDEVSELTRLQVAQARVFAPSDLESPLAETLVYSIEPNLEEFLPPDSSNGSLLPGPGEVVLEQGLAESFNLNLGDQVVLLFEQIGQQTFTVVGTAQGSFWDNLDISISRSYWSDLLSDASDSQLYIRAAAGVTPDNLKAAVEDLTDSLPTVVAQTQDDLLTTAEESINQLLNLILALLGVTVIIGMLGVTNTMALAVFERTREIGLLRAVGLDRRTTRWMVRIEAVVVSVFGGLLGIGLGIVFGWMIIRALGDSGFTSFVIPWIPNAWNVSGLLGSLLFWVLAIAVLGVIFATYPARRAAKLKVVDAIAHL